MNDFRPNGKKEVAEGVLIAVLSAIGVALVNWGIDHLKSKVAKPDTGKKCDG